MVICCLTVIHVALVYPFFYISSAPVFLTILFYGETELIFGLQKYNDLEFCCFVCKYTHTDSYSFIFFSFLSVFNGGQDCIDFQDQAMQKPCKLKAFILPVVKFAQYDEFSFLFFFFRLRVSVQSDLKNDLDYFKETLTTIS